MSDTPTWGGDKRGPYRLGKRYLDGAEEEWGRLYEAQNTETGARAVVLVPRLGARGPRLPWAVRARSGVSPPYLALEVDEAPPAQAPALHELTLMMIHLSGAMATLEEREDARTFLTRDLPVKPFWKRRFRRQWLYRGTGALTTVGLALTALLFWQRPPPPPGAKLNPTPPEVTQEDPVAWVDQHDVTPDVVGYPLPASPYKEQRKPPCLQGTEVEINGGCWVTLEKRAPCPRSTAEHEGKCYMPVRQKPPDPSSVEP